MSPGPPTDTARRSDAQRNRTRILDAARLVFTEPPGPTPSVAGATPEQSMAEVARRAGVGRGTVYRNFSGRRELLEALFADEVDALIAAAVPSDDTPGTALFGWLHRFAAFQNAKHGIVHELLEYTDSTNPMFDTSRHRVIAAGEPLMAAAQRSGHIRHDVTLAQALDLVLAVARLRRAPEQVGKILQIALDGLRADSR